MPSTTPLPRRTLCCVLAAASLAAASLAAIGTAPAVAGPSFWTPLIGLTDNNNASINNPEWVRAFAAGTPPTTLYAGTEGAGVWKSINDGLTWSQFSTGLLPNTGPYSGGDVLDSFQLFTSGGDLYDVTGGNLFSAPDSVASGGTFTAVAPSPQTDPPTKLLQGAEAVITLPGNVWLAGTNSGGLYKSADGGKTWMPEPDNNGLPDDGQTIWSFANFQGFVWAATTDGIFRSSDSGTTWSLSSDGIPASAITLGVFEDTGNPLIFYAETASDGIYRSIDGGTTWQSIDGDGTAEPFGGNQTPTVHAIQEFSTNIQTKLYVGTSDGVWVGTLPNVSIKGTGKSIQVPGTPVWRNVTSTGFKVNNPIVWSLASFTTLPGTLLAGTQDEGGASLTFQPPVNDGQPADVPTWILASILPIQVGAVLNGQPGVWSGTPQIDYAYQWQLCTTKSSSTCTDIDGATDADFTIPQADLGEYVREVVTASNDFPSLPKAAYTASSIVAGPVLMAAGPVPGSTQEDGPTITDPTGDIGMPNEGDTLAAPKGAAGGNGGWYFNPTANTVLYQWLRCDFNGGNCANIAGATNPTYKLTAADGGNTIDVQIIGENGHGASDTLDSGPSNPIIPLPAKDTSPPTINGTAQVNELLVGNVGVWASPATYWTRQWLLCEPGGSDCSPIEGATGAEYGVTADDLGMSIELEVTADVNPLDQNPPPVTVDSKPTAPVTAAPAGSTPPTLPTITPPATSTPTPVTPTPVTPAPVTPAAGTPAAAAGSGSGSAGSSAGGGSSIPASPLTGPAAPMPPALIPPAPVLALVKLARTGRGLTFTLSSPGSVVLLLERGVAGHKHGRSCLAGGAHKRSNSCTVFTTVATVVREGLLAGAGTISLPTTLHGKPLPPGTYHVVVVSHGTGGTVGKPVTIPLVLARV